MNFLSCSHVSRFVLISHPELSPTVYVLALDVIAKPKAMRLRNTTKSWFPILLLNFTFRIIGCIYMLKVGCSIFSKKLDNLTNNYITNYEIYIKKIWIFFLLFSVYLTYRCHTCITINSRLFVSVRDFLTTHFC